MSGRRKYKAENGKKGERPQKKSEKSIRKYNFSITGSGEAVYF